jgi:hypothetical protein
MSAIVHLHIEKNNVENWSLLHLRRVIYCSYLINDGDILFTANGQWTGQGQNVTRFEVGAVESSVVAKSGVVAKFSVAAKSSVVA